MGFLDRRGDLVIGVPRDAFRPSAVFLGILAVFLAAGVLAWQEIGNNGVDVFLFVVAGWLVSLCVHEYAHAIVAYRAGDIGVAHRGYLRLNPLKYANPVLSIALPLLFIILGGIALPGGAVMIDHSHVRSRRMDSLISLAGPAVNLVFAVALMLPFAAGVNAFAHPVFWAAVAYLAFFQTMAAVLNLLPIPGLDGGNAVFPWLSNDWKRGFNAVRPYGFILLFLILWQTSLGYRIVQGLLNGLLALGMPGTIFNLGSDLFRFWN